jgi:hypothetical protein
MNEERVLRPAAANFPIARDLLAGVTTLSGPDFSGLQLNERIG